jgi:hypothetical protein
VTGDGSRRLLLVVGIGRSGTSVFTGIVGQLGWYVPQPEVQADSTNPRGFGEPKWAVDFHSQLQRVHRVTNMDSRPAAFTKLAANADDPAVVGRLRDWLGEQFDKADDVVVKDPRIVWFLPLWQRCADELKAETSFATMLRHPTEVLASARTSYGAWQNDASRAAAWLNVMLHTEHATRDAARAFIRYEDLLTDWEQEITRIAAPLGIDSMADIGPDQRAAVGSFVDPTLRRSKPGWDDVDVPARVRDMIEDVWATFGELAKPGGDNADVRHALDAARLHYRGYYAEVESVAQSSINAVRPRKKAAAKPARRATLRQRVVRRLRRGLHR